VDDTLRSINSATAATIDFVNRSGSPVDIYWINGQGGRRLDCAGVAVGATCTRSTFLTHPFLVVVSGTGGTTARDTGTRLAGFEAVTPNGAHDPAIRDTAIITGVEGMSTPSPNKGYRAGPGASENIVPKPDATQLRAMVNPKDGLTYVWIAPGSFTMGCSPGDGQCYDDEKPTHQVTIASGFRMGRTTVTQEAYQRVVGKSPSHFKGAQLPVDSVNWDEAQSYCRAVGMRLPTEAEWEYAARAGSTASRYGNIDEIAWYGGNSGSRTHEVMQKQPNAWGLYDTLGNIRQWTTDLPTRDYSVKVEANSGPTGGMYRVLRGGFYGLGPELVRVSYRSADRVEYRGMNIGFRCVGN
jgi:formylglycine-generating enzyme required for sulfatase activity